MDNNKIKIQATVDLPSEQKINEQIRTLEKKINKLKITGEIDDSTLRNLTNRLNNLKATVTTVNFSPNALRELENTTQKLFANVNTNKAINSVNSLGDALDWLKEKLSIFETIEVGKNMFKGFKNVGENKMYSSVLKMPTITCVLWDTKVFMLSNVEYTW